MSLFTEQTLRGLLHRLNWALLPQGVRRTNEGGTVTTHSYWGWGNSVNDRRLYDHGASSSMDAREEHRVMTQMAMSDVQDRWVA